ncbi:hypothetical protein T484DRAFT_1768194 [Baffinella frigidus]|nr:hypothetical protein T484DRAFT_1768194 [Cryptophyta sp. CCMP2293]
MAVGCGVLRARRRGFVALGDGCGFRFSLATFLSLVVTATGLGGLSPADPGGVGALMGFSPAGFPVYSRPAFPPATPFTDSEDGAALPFYLDDNNNAQVGEDWYLPPSLGGSDWAETPVGASGCASGFSEESGYLSDDGEVRRRCSLCKLMDATRGVTEEGEEGLWSTLLCRHCAQFIKKTISISTRCHSCKRFANFGPVGGKRRDAKHCKRHAGYKEVNVHTLRCVYKGTHGRECGEAPMAADPNDR